MTDLQSVVFVIDDDRSMRDALELLLESVGLTVKSFASPHEFVAEPRPDAAACLVLDVRMPGQSGLDLQAELAREKVDIPIIFISGHADIPISVRAMKAGAIEFLSKPFREQELLDAIEAGLSKDRERRAELTRQAALRAGLSSLSAREQAVMLGVVRGASNREIAAELGVSEITVKVRRGHVMRKMGVTSLADLVKAAIALGLS